VNLFGRGEADGGRLPSRYSWRTPVFFEADSHLEGDPAQAQSAQEAGRLRREARQRARLCEAMVRLAAAEGFGAVRVYRVARAAGVGLSTFYKFYESREACLLDAFESCAAATLARVEEAVGEVSDPAGKVEAGLAALLAGLAADPGVARLLLLEIRVGDGPCREAQLRWLERWAELLERAGRELGGVDVETAVTVEVRTGDLADSGTRRRTLARMAELLERADAQEAAPAPHARSRLTSGALATLLALRVARGEAVELPAMLDELFYVALAPYLGAEAAAEPLGLDGGGDGEQS